MQVLVRQVVSIGRRNTQVEPDLHLKTKVKSLTTVDQREHYPG